MTWTCPHPAWRMLRANHHRTRREVVTWFTDECTQCREQRKRVERPHLMPVKRSESSIGGRSLLAAMAIVGMAASMTQDRSRR